MKPQAADLSRGKDYPSEPERAHWLPNQSAVVGMQRTRKIPKLWPKV